MSEMCTFFPMKNVGKFHPPPRPALRVNRFCKNSLNVREEFNQFPLGILMGRVFIKLPNIFNLKHETRVQHGITFWTQKPTCVLSRLRAPCGFLDGARDPREWILQRPAAYLDETVKYVATARHLRSLSHHPPPSFGPPTKGSSSGKRARLTRNVFNDFIIVLDERLEQSEF